MAGAFKYSATFTRPSNTTAYASGDLVANSTTVADVAPLTWSNVNRATKGAVLVRRVRLTKDDDDTTNAQFRLHLFNSNPTLTNPINGDNGAIQLTGVLDNHLGSFDFNLSTSPDIHTDGNMGVGVPVAGQEVVIEFTDTDKVYGLMEARAAYTPADGEIFVVELELVRD